MIAVILGGMDRTKGLSRCKSTIVKRQFLGETPVLMGNLEQ